MCKILSMNCSIANILSPCFNDVFSLCVIARTTHGHRPSALLIDDDLSLTSDFSKILQLHYHRIDCAFDLTAISSSCLDRVDHVYLGLKLGSKAWIKAINQLADLSYQGRITLFTYASPTETQQWLELLTSSQLRISAIPVFIRVTHKQRILSNIRRLMSSMARQIHLLQGVNHHPVYI